ncbi:hypothetical protein [Pseudalkalibacillus salsuginis]|uniref:hypothetical protein n=1 Tax=Pseudalkalibacillus salsuginis TaxID=2910972 RepID=UPI001F3080F3|nr:hypothetical protein [Pseudalkalibacillus salsuginis]MCF6409538.1 hypothetical protein [Pseudalkalibacillus salsuginis]
MFIKNKKFVVILVAAFSLGVILLYSYLNSSFYLNGNDKESIIKTIHSIETYEDSSIEIIEIKDIGNQRIVPFLDNGRPAFIHFVKNKYGNYKWKGAERSGGSLSNFLIYNRNKEDGHFSLLFLVVTTKENEIAKMELRVNEHVFVEEFDINKNSATWIELPSDKEMRYTYKYYDKDGSLIE